jgi:peptide/nickel transport system substrate-binding protein
MKKVGLILIGLLVVFSTAAVAQYYDGLQDPKVLDLGSDDYPGLVPGVQGGTFYISAISNPKKWNDVTAHETSTTQYTNQFLRGLMTIHPITGALVPELVRDDGITISPDGLTVEFKLRRGVKWSDGTEFTSADVMFTYNDLILNEDVETDSRDGLELPDGTFPVMTAPDAYTIKLEMSQIFRPVFNSFTFNILPKHVLEGTVHKLNPAVPAGNFNEVWGLDTDPADLVGLGPFLIESYTPDQNVTMKRNPYYYAYDQDGTQLPYVDKYVILTVESQDVSLLKFRNGEIDALGIRPSDVPILVPEAAANDFEVKIGSGVYGTLWVSFNQDFGLDEGDAAKDNIRGMFRDVRFRQAVHYAMDKQSIINNLYNGLAAPQWSPVSVPSPFYGGRSAYGAGIDDAAAVNYEYDLAKAAGLLDDMGLIDNDGDGIREFADGQPVEFLLETNAGNTLREGFCLILADDLEKIGVKANFQPVDFNTLVTRLLSGTLYEACVVGLTGGNEPNGGANVYRTTGGLHFWHYSAPDDPYAYELRIDELFDLGLGTFDLDEAFGYYQEYQVLFATDDIGMNFSVNQQFTYAIYNRVGNQEIADVTATPTGSNGLAWDLVFFEAP